MKDTYFHIEIMNTIRTLNFISSLLILCTIELKQIRYTKSHFPYQMNIQRLAYLSQLVSSEIIELNLSIIILLQVTTAHDDITTSVFLLST